MKDNYYHIIAVGVIILLALLIFIFGHAQDYTYKASWLTNKEPDMWRYAVYFWEGKDTTSSPFKEGVAAQTYNDYFLMYVVHDSSKDTTFANIVSTMNGNWMQIAVAAQDSAGNLSGVAVSNFLKKEDKQPPAQPKDVEVSY